MRTKPAGPEPWFRGPRPMGVKGVTPMFTRSRMLAALTLVLATALPATAQDKTQNKTYEIRQPTGKWQVPGEIKQPTGPWQVPGDIQVPKGIQAVKSIAVSRCERRLSVVTDALFDFDKASLRPDAE